MSLLVKSPGDGSTIATVKQTPMSELDTIGKRAKDAAKVWKKTSIAERQAICR
jgi:acyl-CoA reductase-like NAD-dependent aldehyde dehydrogenase